MDNLRSFSEHTNVSRFIRTVTAMPRITRRWAQFLALCVATCVVAITVLLMWRGELKPQTASPSTPATYVDEPLGFRVSLPSPWVVIFAARESIGSDGHRHLPGSAGALTKLDVDHPHGKARLLTAMNPTTRESFQVLREEQASPVDETRPEITADELRSMFVRLLAMRPLGPVERLGGVKPVAHFNGVLKVNGTKLYQSIFVALAKTTEITFVFSGSASTVLSQSERSFPQWVSFDRTPGQ